MEHLSSSASTARTTNWVWVISVVASAIIHAAALAFILSSSSQRDLYGLQPGDGRDDLSIVVTVTMQTENGLGSDAVTAERQDASAGGRMPAPAKPETGDERADPAREREETTTQEKPREAEERKERASVSAVPVEAQQEQRALSRTLEARRSEVLSLYNSKIYQALTMHAIRPKANRNGRVIIELTIAPSGALLAHRVIGSSGSKILDGAAMATLERSAPFPPAPSELNERPYTLSVPFDYSDRR